MLAVKYKYRATDFWVCNSLQNVSAYNKQSLKKIGMISIMHVYKGCQNTAKTEQYVKI